jgi:hypothetical protein
MAKLIPKGERAKAKRDKRSRLIQARRQGEQTNTPVKAAATSSICITGKKNCRCMTCLFNLDKAQQLAREAARTVSAPQKRPAQ